MPIRSNQVLIPDEVRKNPYLWREIDRDVTDILDCEPGKFLRDQIIRPRYVPKQPVDLSQDEIVAAPLPNRLIEKELPGPGLLAFVFLERFLNHQPYYRLQQTFLQRHQIHLARQPLSDCAAEGAQWLIPVVKLMKERLLRLKYLQVDETPIHYLDRDEPGKSRKGYLWAYSDPKGCSASR